MLACLGGDGRADAVAGEFGDEEGDFGLEDGDEVAPAIVWERGRKVSYVHGSRGF